MFYLTISGFVCPNSLPVGRDWHALRDVLARTNKTYRRRFFKFKSYLSLLINSPSLVPHLFSTPLCHNVLVQQSAPATLQMSFSTDWCPCRRCSYPIRHLLRYDISLQNNPGHFATTLVLWIIDHGYDTNLEVLTTLGYLPNYNIFMRAFSTLACFTSPCTTRLLIGERYIGL